MANGHGGYRENSGNKTKIETERIRDLVSPYTPNAIQCLVNIMENENAKSADRIAAAKLLIAYHYGNPTSSVDHSTMGEKIQNIINLGIGVNPNTDEVQNIED